MKSFADWTQELAESVGEVKHHWETPEPKADLSDLDEYEEYTAGNIDYTRVGNTIYANIPVAGPGGTGKPIKGLPQAPMPPCEYCGNATSVGRWEPYTAQDSSDPCVPPRYWLCDSCGQNINFRRIS